MSATVDTAPAGTDEVLRIDGLTVRFGGVVAVNNVSLSLRPGLLYGLVGPNGSGKSTLLGAISRLTRSSGGRIQVSGTEISTLAPDKVFRLGLSRTFQTVRLLPTMSVLENVMVGCDSDAQESGMRAGLRSLLGREVEATARKTALAALKLLGLAELADARPTALAYGMQRRVEIARALVSDPKLVLYDEPTAGMTRSERADISQVLRELRGSGHTQLIVDHDVDMMVDICDHLFVMNYGALIASGKPAEVIALPAVQEAYLGKR